MTAAAEPDDARAAGGCQLRELTPAGRGGVTVLELCGPGARERVARLAQGRLFEPGAPRLVRLVLAGVSLDEALVWVDGPERVELHLHGSPPLVARLTEALGVPAAPDVAGAMSLEERAEALLCDAPSDPAARVLLDQAGGALRRELEDLRRVIDEPAAFRPRLATLLERGRIARWLFEPPLVVLAGAVNAGKSTLFNALVGRERVVVSAVAGTTRDAIRERVRLGEWSVDLVDVAGEREPDRSSSNPDATIERAGQAVGRALAQRAALVLRLVPAVELARGPRAGREVADSSRQRTVASRADELGEGADLDPSIPRVSALTDPAAAPARVEDVVRGALGLPRRPWERAPLATVGVPFEPGQVAALETMTHLGPAGRGALLARLLTR